MPILPYPLFKLDHLNSFVILSIAIFSVLIILYSSRFMKGRPKPFQYYCNIILSSLASVGVVLTNNLILLSVFWGFLGLTLYLLINMQEDASEVAKKTFIIVGGSDALMLLGISIIYYLTGTFQMDKIRISLASTYSLLLPASAYLCLAIACFAKAGAMPFHSWIPDCAKSAPLPVVAFLPAALDKLLGIYLLARISLNLFVMNDGMNIFLMITGAFTIIAAVMMALMQHNAKKLLGYHAVSQVGYMVLGIGTGNPIGIAGGIFHMLNNAIYKSCLFLTTGNVEYRAKTTELDELGGLSKAMPLTYICALIASLSISGVPPFNGFVSKWMIYQGLIHNLQLKAYSLKLTAILCLVAALFGSALTLASFMKLIHAIFLGQAHSAQRTTHSEVPWRMWLPCVLLAIICAVFGIFANLFPLKYFIFPAVNGVTFLGNWYGGSAAFLIICGLLLGLLLLKLRGLKPVVREDSSFFGGETRAFSVEEGKASTAEFYNTVKEWGMLAKIYKKAEAGAFDIYEQGKKLIFSVGGVFQYLHNGILPTYMVWYLLGMVAVFYFLLVR